MNHRASRLPKCYQIFIQRLIRFPPRLTVADCCCVGQIPGVKALHECDAWCCWKRTCMLSKTLPRIQGGGWCGVEGLLNKTTTTGPRQRSPLLGLIQTIRFRNSNTCGQSKFTQQLSSTWMIDGAATGLRHMSCRVKIWISALNLAPSIQLCHRPGAALPLMFDICLDAFTLPKKKAYDGLLLQPAVLTRAHHHVSGLQRSRCGGTGSWFLLIYSVEIKEENPPWETVLRSHHSARFSAFPGVIYSLSELNLSTPASSA